MKRILLFFFIFLSVSGWAQGNLLSISSAVPQQMTICGATKSFSVDIYNPSPFLLTNDTLKITMPTGVAYQSGSIVGATYINTILPNTLVFVLANMPTLTTTSITFSASANCDVMPYIASGAIIQNQVRINYTANGSTNYDTHSTSSYIIRQPNLSILSVTNQSYTGNIGDVYSRCISITNGGLGELSQFTLSDVHGSGAQITAVSIGNWTNVGSTETIVLSGANFSTVGDGDNLFENGESITICETVHVINCISVSSAFEAYWGCTSDHCQSSISNANVVFPNLIPNLVFTPNDGNVYYQMGSCITQASQQQLKIVNNGLGQASNVFLDIFQSTSSGYNPNVASNIDPTSFTVQVGLSGAATPISIDGSELVYTMGCMAPTAKGRTYLTIPTINPGDTVYLKWNTYSCCWNNCAGIGQYYINGWRFKGTYKSVCDNAYVIPESWGKVYSYVYGDLVNNSSPSNLINGQTGTFSFVFANYDFWYPVGPGANWRFEFTLPACLSYTGNVKLVNYNELNTWNPSSVMVSGNTVTAVFNGAAPFNLSQAAISIDLTANCASCGNSGSNTPVSIKSFYVPDNTCGCDVEVSCQNASVSIICPTPCPEGLQFTNFDLRRTNYGLPDNEPGGGDGVPDNSGSLNFSKVKTDRVMFGDTILCTFNGTVKTSISYPSWQYGYVTSTMTNGDNFSFLSAVLTIYRGGSVFATCNSFTPTVTTSGSTRTFLFNISAAALGACVPGGFTYQNNDSLVFEPKYTVTGNITWTVVSSSCSNEFYMSDIANPTLQANKFQCNTINGNCTIVGYGFYNCCPDNYAVKSCENVTVSQNYYFWVGPAWQEYRNSFPYEYRNWSHPKTFTSIVPTGYNYVSARFIYYRTAGTNNNSASAWTTITPINPNTDTLIFPVEQFFQGYGGTLPLSDDGYAGTVELTVQPSCKVTPTITQVINDIWDFSTISQLTGPGSYSTTSGSYNQDSIVYQSPNLFLQSTLPSIVVADSVGRWDISISNTSNVSDASNAWLSFPTISGVTVNQVIDLGTNLPIPITGSIYQLGVVSASSVRNFRVLASFTSCNQDSIIAYAGWNCSGGYPTTINNYPCIAKTITLKLTPLIPALTTNVTGPPSTIQLCDTASYIVEGTNVQLGNAYQTTLLATLPVGVIIIPGTTTLQYPSGGSSITIADPVYQSGTIYQWDTALSNHIGANGLKGALDAPQNTFKLTFKVTTNCSYTSGSNIGFSLKGKAACGFATGQEVTLSTALGITGATTPYHTDIHLSTTYISPCAANSTMKVTVNNQGPNPFGVIDSILIKLPTGVSFVSGSYSSIHNGPTNGTPTEFNLNGNVHLLWLLTQGVVVGDSTVFTFDYKGDADALSCDISRFVGQTISSANVLCTLTGNNCGINIITGDTTLSVFTYKAYLSLSNGKATSIPNPPGGETVTVNLDITNTGQEILSGANSIIQFYYDANGNGIYNSGDVFILQDSFAVSNNSTMAYSNTFNAPSGKVCSIIAVIDTSVNPCVCNPSQLLVHPVLKSLGNDTTICSKQTMALGSAAITDYTYSWATTTDLSSATIANPLLTAVNNTSSPISTDYILTTTRAGCTAQDTIKITVNPLPVSSAGTDVLTCPSNTPANLGQVSGNAYAYHWSPSIGLSDTTLANPTVSITAADTTLYILTASDLGCTFSDSVLVTVNPLPNATISGTTVVCYNAISPSILLKGSIGVAPYVFTYIINGGAPQIISSISDSVIIIVPTNVTGTFIYKLINVQDASPTTCSRALNDSVIISVNALPTATVSGSTTVCEGDSAPAVIFIGSMGTAPYSFTYTLNGGTDQLATSIGDSASIFVNTAIPGTYNYILKNVSYVSTSVCSQLQNDTAIVKINPSPTATITGTTTLCKNAPLPNITFTGANGTSPYTFHYTLNGGALQTISTVSGNSVTVAAPTDSAGIFTYSLVSVSDSSITACSQTQAGNAIITVNPLPTAIITGSTDVCVGATLPNITVKGFGSTAPYTINYKINSGTTQTINTAAGDSVLIAVPTAASGTYIYQLVSIAGADSTTCSQFQNDSVIIHINPLPVAAISGTTIVCKNDSLPHILFTGSSGTAPYTFTYSINNGSNQTITTNGGDSVSLQAPTNAAGAFIYKLISVSDSSSTHCMNAQNDSITITVNPTPTATISGSAATCQFATQPIIIFTGAGATQPYTFTYKINGVTQPSITTSSGDSDTIAVSTDSVGVFVYSLVNVKDGAAHSCSLAQSGTATITVNAKPIADFSHSKVCFGNNTMLTDSSFTSIGTVNSWHWNLGDNNTDTIPLVSHLYAAGGIYTATLIVKNNFGCADTISHNVVVDYSPIVAFSHVDVCFGDSMHFQNTSSIDSATSITGYIWNFNDGSPNSVLKNPSHFYSTSGTYNITLVATAANGCSAGTSVGVKVFDLPHAAFIVNHTCLFDSTLFTNSSTNPLMDTIGNWSWNFGDGSVVNTADWNPYHTYSSAGNYQVSLIAKNAIAGCSDTTQLTITVFPKAIANFTYSDVCLNELTLITDSSYVTVDSIVAWWWNFGDGSSVAQVKDTTHAYAQPGTYLITHIVSTINGCKDTVTKNTNIHPLPLVNYSTLNVCEGSTTLFTNTSSIFSPDSIVNYSWNFGDGSPINNVHSTSHLYAATGNYTVGLTAVSNFGCVDSIKKTSVINPNPIANFTSLNKVGCEPLCITLIDSSTIASGSNVIWTWNAGDGSGAGNTQNFSYCYTYDSVTTGSVFTPIMYTPQLTVSSDSGCTTSILKPNYITVYPKPIANFNLTPTTTTIINPLISISDLSIGAQRWLWNYGDGLSDSAIVSCSYTHSYSDTGSYIISLITNTQYGCADSVYHTVVIQPDFTFFIPNSFSPNDDGLNDTFSGKGIFISQYDLSIFDRWGNLIYTSDNINKPWDGKVKGKTEVAEIDVYVYLIKIVDVTGTAHHYKGSVTVTK